jgi:tRNA A37 threonylcarbamoyladenosine biosynthesis protein TsaE
MVSAGLEEFLQPDGVSVIEWAERLLVNEHPTSNIQHPTSKWRADVRQVTIEIIGESERKIIYDDFGA